MLKLHSRNRIRALVSIHDVMPHNLDKIDHCLHHLERNNINTCYLLVVPGLSWDTTSLLRLRKYVADGHKLVAHGWVHKTGRIDSFYHHLHSIFMSRDVAEHLSIGKSQAVSLMRRSRTWFADNQLPVPDFYVPPAWALGDLKLDDLNKTGFRYVESTTGIFDLTKSSFQFLPLVGFEADSLVRATGLSLSNLVNRAVNRFLPASPLRVAIHPDDFELRLSESLHRTLALISEEPVHTALQPYSKHSIGNA